MHASDEPGQGKDDVVAFGWREHAVVRYVRRIRWLHLRTWGLCAAAALAGSLATLAVGGGTRNHLTGEPVTSIAIQNASTANFALNSRLNLVIAVEYLRVGSSTSPAGLPGLPLSGGTTWATVVVTGLPAYGSGYEVTAGECSHGRAVSLGAPESAAADPAGVLILQVGNLPAPFDSSRFWIQVSSVTGQILAEIRGPIFPVTNGRLIAPGTAICQAA
jgi:hypothetical protein